MIILWELKFSLRLSLRAKSEEHINLGEPKPAKSLVWLSASGFLTKSLYLKQISCLRKKFCD